MKPRVRLLLNRDYVLLTAGETVSTLGSVVASFAMPLVVLGLTGSPLQAGVVATISMLGSLFGSAIVGGWIDGHSRRVAMLVSLAIRTTVWLLFAVLVAVSWFNLAVFAALGFLGGMSAAHYRAAEAGALKLIVQRDQLPTAMSVIEGRGAAADIAGGPVGALMLGVSFAFPFWFNAASFLASLVGVVGIRAELGKPEGSRKHRFRESLAAGLKFIGAQPAFRTLISCQALSNFGMNAFIFAVILLFQRQGEPYWLIGLYSTCLGVSLLAGSLIAPYLVRTVPVGRLIVASAGLRVAMLLLVVLWIDTAYFVLGFVVCGFLLAPAASSAAQSYIMVVTPDAYQGRVAAAGNFVGELLMPMTALTAGYLISALRPQIALVILACAVVVSTLVMLVDRQVRTIPRLTKVREAVVS